MPNVPLHVKAGSRRAYRVREHLFRFLATAEETGGSYALMEIESPPGSGPGLHVHEEAEETFYVLGGEVTFQIGSERLAASTGDFIHIPRGTLHRFEVGQGPARLLASYAPAGDELPFLELGVPADVDQPASSEE